MRGRTAVQAVLALTLSGLFCTSLSLPLCAQTESGPEQATASLAPSSLATSSLATSSLAPSSFEIAARSRGTPDFPGLNMVWLVPWIDLRHANHWRNIIVHQAEGPAGSAYRSALAQMEKPWRKGVTIWVETDGTVYWAVAEFAVPSHIRSGNRSDNKFIDNAQTFLQLDSSDSIGVEFVGNYPDVRRPVTDAQVATWKILLKILQTRYGIPDDRVFAHNWIDYKDRRYCEGCELARLARTRTMQAATQLMLPATRPVMPPASQALPAILPSASDGNTEQKSNQQ